jgi:hypothetical protein
MLNTTPKPSSPSLSSSSPSNAVATSSTNLVLALTNHSSAAEIAAYDPNAKVITNTVESRLDMETVSMSFFRKRDGSEDFLVFSRPVISKPGTGEFYSRNTRVLGVWRLSNNAIILSWGSGGGDSEILRASKTEREFTNESVGLTLKVVDPPEPLLLPLWLAPNILADRFHHRNVAETYNECAICHFELFRLPVDILRIQSRGACGHFFHGDCAKHYLASKSTNPNLTRTKNAGDDGGDGQDRRRGKFKSLLSRMSSFIINHLPGSIGNNISSSSSSSSHRQCPTCGSYFSDVKIVPDVMRDPRGWF